MVNLNELLTKEDLEKAMEMSDEKLVLLFKQSTTCPISADAFHQYNEYLDETDEDLGAYFVKVRETREVSNQIAEDTGIQHQSPQIFLIKNKEVLWNTSHSDITVEHIEQAVAETK
ncbi:MAG TPA: bacillithiol system redox-active protein YtxJ [Candidatus Avamphibacillus sp.]|nr:bacillithiol system redox-active protein YtxJ [Candidatus Avamphibacillus sp.]